MWNTQSLGGLCSLITDGKHGDCKNDESSGYYFISCKDVKDGRINYENARQIVEVDFAETHRRTDLKAGDLLLTNSGTIGRLAIATDDEKTSKTTFQKSVAVLKPINDKITSHFLYYKLIAEKNRLINSAGGAAQKNLLLGELRRFEIGLPSIDLQNEISSKIIPYDLLIENNRRRIQLLEESVRLLYKEWFVHLRFPGHEHVKITEGVPEGWSLIKLVEFADLTMGQSPKSEFYNEVGEGLPFHQGVTNYGFRFVSHKTYCTKITRIAESGDILCSVRAPVGRLNITLDKMILGRGLAAIRAKSGHQSFLFYSLRTFFFKEDIMGSGAIYASVTKKDMEGVELLIPSLMMLQEFEDQASEIDRQIINLSKQNYQLTQARDILLPRLMSGELTV